MRYAHNTTADRVTARHVLPNSTEERHDDLQSVVYTYTSARGVPYAIGCAVTAYRPGFHHRFVDADRRARFVASRVDRLRARVACRQKRQATR